MVFNSIEFALFFPLVFAFYWLFFKKRPRGRNLYLIVVSYIFYGCWDWRFLSLIVISSFVDYCVGKELDKQSDTKKRKMLLMVSLVTNFGFLGFFKYFNFFVNSFSSVFTLFGIHPTVSTLKVLLPVGISFYTFQTLSYTLDIYYKKMKPTSDVLGFFAFVSFFPQLVAGPIERARNLLPQFEGNKSLDYEKMRKGVLLIASGLFKKIVLADRLAVYVDQVYGDIPSAEGMPSVFAVLFFAFQLYFDFSAYSEIAIGSAKLLDFNLSKNFHRPYLSGNFSEFWKRWHISLSSWFRDYLYIPLGGNRKGVWATRQNLFIVFLLSGLWHGASWNFVIWGALNAGFLILLDPLLNKLKPNSIRSVFSVVMVFLCWSFSLVLFRGQTISDALSVYANLGFKNVLDISHYGLNLHEFRFTICILVLAITVEILQEKISGFYNWFISRNFVFRWMAYLTVVISILLFGVYGIGLSDNTFIYFQF